MESAWPMRSSQTAAMRRDANLKPHDEQKQSTSSVTIPGMSPLVTLPDAAKDFVRGGGGSLYIWPSRHRCCSGTLTLLEAGSTAPAAKRIWTRVDQADIQVFLDSSIPEAQEIDVLLRRWPRPHLTAFWNGCAWVG